MQTYPEIKRFVQETLGCSCPEEVFNKIDHQKESDDISGRKITVGDRLLIYIITIDGKSNIQGVVNSALGGGSRSAIKKDLTDSDWCLWMPVRMRYAAWLNTPSIVQDVQMKRHTFIS